jgi:hypothetical protein
VLSRTACRGHQPHHDHPGRTGGRLIPTIAANERNRIEARLAAFERRHNATATTFDWTLTASDLDDLPRPHRRRPEQAPITQAARTPRTSGADRLEL